LASGGGYVKQRCGTRSEKTQSGHIPYLGLDEKQCRLGHRYLSSLVDRQDARVFDIVEQRI
jgi:hypothetical protein